MLHSLISALLFIIAVWASFFVLYQLVLALMYFVIHEPTAKDRAPETKFAIIIPAHNEAVMIRTALDSWKQVYYPKELFEVYVIADNCDDETAAIASQYATVFERTDQKRKGKGHALAWAIQKLPLSEYGAVVIVDSDALVCQEFLAAMNTRLLSGAKAVQGYPALLNPDETAMTRLIQVTSIMKHALFNHAKSKLGLSVELRGLGMCFNARTLLEIGWTSFSKTEDGEQFAYLAEAGIQLQYEPRAVVYAYEAGSFGQAYTQRLRWVSGRMQLLGRGLRLFIKGICQKDLTLLDASLTILLPNYVELANVTIGGLAILLMVDLPGRSHLLPWFAALLVCQILYFGIGLVMSAPTPRVLAAILVAPVFLTWRGFINVMALFHVRDSHWVRAARPSHVYPHEQTSERSTTVVSSGGKEGHS